MFIFSTFAYMSRDSSVIIPAAGFSSRMNRPKFALQFDKNQTFLEKIAYEFYQFGCKEIVIVLNSEGIETAKKLNMNLPDTIRFTENKYPEKERFYSIQTGLNALTDFQFVFISNIDNPFVDQEVLTALYKYKTEADYIVPVYKDKGGHPILINKRIAEALKNTDDQTQHLGIFLKLFNRKQIPSTQHITININTKQEYLSYFNERLFSI